MKKIQILLSFLLAAAVAMGQSTVPLRGDTIRLYKQNGNAELTIENSTRSKAGAVLRNKGNGRTEFSYVVDSIKVVDSVLTAFIGDSLVEVMPVMDYIRAQYYERQQASFMVDTGNVLRLVTDDWQSPYNIRILAQGRPFGFLGYTASPESQGAAVSLGQYAGAALHGNNWTGNVLIGNEAGRYDQTGAHVAIGNWALKYSVLGYRDVAVGHSSMFNSYSSSFCTNVGAFTSELLYAGDRNSHFGYSSGRSNKIGVDLTGVGNGTLLQTTTEVASAAVVNPGTGYTSIPTVTLSAPQPGSPGGLSVQATATATINGAGQVTSIIITNPGAGYIAAPTVTITGGGGSGATAVTTIITGNYSTATGSSSFQGNRVGSHLTGDGYLTGYGAGGNEMSVRDQKASFFGAQASRHGSISNATTLTNITAIGYNSKVSTSNSLVLGGLGADAVKVGIGTHAPATELNVVGNMRLDYKSSIPSLALNASWNLGTAPNTHTPMGEIIFMPSAGQTWSNGASIRGVLNHHTGGIDELNGLVFYTSARTGYAGQSNFGDRDQMFLNGYGALILAQGGTASAWDGQSALLVRSKFASTSFKVQSWQNYTGTEIANINGLGKLTTTSLTLSSLASPGAGTRSIAVDENGNVIVGSGGSGGGTTPTLDQVLTAGNVSATRSIGLGVVTPATRLQVEETAGNTSAASFGVTGGSGAGVMLYNRNNPALFSLWGIDNSGNFQLSSANAALTVGSEGGHSYYTTNGNNYRQYFQPNRVTRMIVSDNPSDYNVDVVGSVRASGAVVLSDLGGDGDRIATIDNAGQVGTGALLSSLPLSATVTTNDATPTTIATITPTASETGVIEVTMTGMKAASVDGITGKKIIRYKYDGSTITLGTITDLLATQADGTISGAAWTITTSGSSIVIRVTGIAATSIIWNASYLNTKTVVIN